MGGDKKDRLAQLTLLLGVLYAVYVMFSEGLESGFRLLEGLTALHG